MKNSVGVFAAVAAMAIVLMSFVLSEPGTDDGDFAEIAYPEGYRDWTHVKTYVVGPNSPAFKFIGGFNHVYANPKAMEGYRTGNFPDGSVIVSDVIEAKVDTISNTREGARHHIDVMVKDSKKYAEFGGWGFEEFADNSHTNRLLTPESRSGCTNCHSKQKDHVFGEYRE